MSSLNLAWLSVAEACRISSDVQQVRLGTLDVWKQSKSHSFVRMTYKSFCLSSSRLTTVLINIAQESDRIEWTLHNCIPLTQLILRKLIRPFCGEGARAWGYPSVLMTMTILSTLTIWQNEIKWPRHVLHQPHQPHPRVGTIQTFYAT